MLGGVVVERQQRVELAGDFAGRFGVVDELVSERSGGVDRGGAGLGVVDLLKRPGFCRGSVG